MAKTCPFLGWFGGMLAQENFVEIGLFGEFWFIFESDFVLHIFFKIPFL